MCMLPCARLFAHLISDFVILKPNYIINSLIAMESRCYSIRVQRLLQELNVNVHCIFCMRVEFRFLYLVLQQRTHQILPKPAYRSKGKYQGMEPLGHEEEWSGQQQEQVKVVSIISNFNQFLISDVEHYFNIAITVFELDTCRCVKCFLKNGFWKIH